MSCYDEQTALSALPRRLQDELNTYWNRVRCVLENDAELAFCNPELIRSINRVWACSPFVANYCTQDPVRFMRLLGSGDLTRCYAANEYQEQVQAALAGVEDEADLRRNLRQLRNREMVRIAWRDLAGYADLEETMSDLSRFADAVLEATLAWLYQQQSQVFGIPKDVQGELQPMVIIAMGKLGAYELNFSSDIDLIFAYPKAGETGNSTRVFSNDEFFNRVGQKLIKGLSEVTEDGFVFRVDLRLRPFGESGPLVMSFDAIEIYYATHARDWERYAMIKARVAAGDRAAGERLLKTLKPFVYRRYLDFGAIQALREMKQLINEEVKRKGLKSNIKLGPGGIREVEFIGQSFQLIRGGRRPILQRRRILEVLGHLRELRYLPGQVVSELMAAYRFLRNTEHRLQAVSDRQTHSLPESELERQRIALGMGFNRWDEFLAALEFHRRHVQHHFALLLEPPASELSSQVRPPVPNLARVWQALSDPEYVTQALQVAGFDDPEAVLAALKKLHITADARSLSQNARERLDRLVPRLLAAALLAPNPATTVTRLVALIETIANRSVYIALLVEYPSALEQLVRLGSASPWITAQIVRQPILLDELLDPRTLYSPPDPAALEAELVRQLSQLSEADLDQEMNALRHFKHAQVLRVAAADITGVLPVRKVSDHLSTIAETVLRAALRLAWDDLTHRHGEPMCVDAGVVRPAGFAIVAYGKLGGFELGYGSDLDLVFLHDNRGAEQMTNGSKPIDNQVFFARLAQRIIHLITTVTPAGKVYDIDARLRPNGSSGLLVSSLEAFADYQHHHAWTWEHQTLVRARPVAGDSAVMTGFPTIRAAVLQCERDEATLKREIREMRERMRRELCHREPGVFDLKQGEGGITDIEFMMQYIVLRWAAVYPQLLETTANRRLLEICAACHLLEQQDCDALHKAYFAYRAKAHALALQEQPALVSDEEFTPQRNKVIEMWQRLFVCFNPQPVTLAG